MTTYDDVTIWWAVQGPSDPAPAPGPPLLLIQGLAYTAEMWFRVLPALSAPRRTIRFDNRGVGRSSVPPTPWTVADMVADTVAVLDAAAVDRAHVFGVSMGGLIAQELALSHPDRVASLILGGTHPGGREAERMEPAAATTLMDRTPKSAREAAEAAVPFMYAESTPRDEIDRDISVRVRYPMRAAAYWGQLDAMRGHHGTLPRLPQLAVPTLVLHGDADRFVQPGNADLLVAAIPGARVEWIKGASHVFWTDETERTVELVNGFLAALPG